MADSKQSGFQDDSNLDKFEKERLDDPVKNKEFKEARDSNQDNFKSFSEGLDSVDKFELLEEAEGIEQNSPEHNKVLAGENFDSFSEGLSSVDKFSLEGEHQEEAKDFKLPLIDYLSNQHGLVLAQSLEKRSETLRELLTRINNCPWSKTVSVVLHPMEYPAEFDHRSQTVHLDLTKSTIEQSLDFAHQLYHVAHRYLGKLYEDGPVDRETFIDTFLWSEVGALICELNVKNDLDDNTAPEINFKIEEENGKYKNVYIENILSESGLEELKDLLLSSLVRDDFINKEFFLRLLISNHQHYLKKFAEDEPVIRRLIAEGAQNGLPIDKI